MPRPRTIWPCSSSERTDPARPRGRVPCAGAVRGPAGVADNGGMPSVLPDGEPMPEDGSLPRHALEGAGERPLGFYLHVPYCATRCGYCDFNTYTASELVGK